jgi:hypothetical protein
MRIFLSLLVAINVVAASAAAEDKMIRLPGPAAPTSVPTAPPPAPAVIAPPAVIAELKDGTKIEMGADGSVTALNADGSKAPVPDGILTLRDNTTFAVKNGKRLDE